MDSALEHWPSCKQRRQARYMDTVIQTSLMVHTAFKLPLRQIEGLMASILTLMDLTIAASDHTTVSSHVAGHPTGLDVLRSVAGIERQHRSAGHYRLRPAFVGRNSNVTLQGADLTPAASPRLSTQQTDASVGMAVLTRMLAAGRLKSARVQRIMA
ncbi:MAG: transposase [Janthinobacterium lividum]